MYENFKKYLFVEKKKVDILIRDFYKQTIINEDEPFLREFLSYGKQFVIQGGRRLHPINLINIFKGLSSEKDLDEYSTEIYRISVAIELLHISNLMLDDFIDKEDYRRGNKTFHRFIAEKLPHNYNNNIDYQIVSAIYGGNLTSLYGVGIITNSQFDNVRKNKALTIYLSGLAGITRSNLLNEYFNQHLSLKHTTLENYLILADKRAKQMETSVALGAVLGNARKSQIQPLIDAMNKVGIIEQIQNDLLGSFGDPKLHSINNDIKTGQSTILNILSYQNADSKQKERLDHILGNREATDDEIAEVREIYINSGAKKFAKSYSNNLKNEVNIHLNKIYPGLRSDSKEFYDNFLEFLTEKDC